MDLTDLVGVGGGGGAADPGWGDQLRAAGRGVPGAYPGRGSGMFEAWTFLDPELALGQARAADKVMWGAGDRAAARGAGGD